MFAFLTDPKFITTAIALAAQLVGHFGLKADTAELTAALSPLYLYVLAHAHAQSGQTAPAPLPVATVVSDKAAA